MKSRIALVAAIAACAAAASSGRAGAAILPHARPGGCDDPTQGNADFEAYGPTDVNVQAGNGRVTVNENAAGTITVFKYPDPSLFNLVKYFAAPRRERHGRGPVPERGQLRRHPLPDAQRQSGFAWLRDWRSHQRYDSPDTPVPVTTYRSPKRLGLRVTDTDLAPPRSARFVREFWVTRAASSPVRSASLVYFENFNPVASHIPLLPIADWCISQTTDQSASYDAGQHAIVNSWSGVDQATGKPASIAVAFGFTGRDSAHQVGGDAYDGAALPGQPPDAYDQAPAGLGLGGADSATGQTDGRARAEAPLRPPPRRGADDDRRRRRRHGGGAGPPPARASRALARQMRAEQRDWRRFLSRRTLPVAPGRRVIDVAKRSLITLRLARAAKTGAIVASANTQGPYGEDWIRDGAFINSLLDHEGLHRWVTKHNRFYARVQASAQNPSAIRPPGNWAMASYSDGVDGAPIPWEIDETGLGAWTLFDHYRHLHGAAANKYLAAVYPAIGRAADFLTACQDPTNGLQCIANEDDNYTPSQSLHGAAPVELGLRSAIAAAKASGRSLRPGRRLAAAARRASRRHRRPLRPRDPPLQAGQPGRQLLQRRLRRRRLAAVAGPLQALLGPQNGRRGEGGLRGDEEVARGAARASTRRRRCWASPMPGGR